MGSGAPPPPLAPGRWCVKTHAPHRVKEAIKPYDPRQRGRPAPKAPAPRAGEALLVEHALRSAKERGGASAAELETVYRLCGADLGSALPDLPLRDPEAKLRQLTKAVAACSAFRPSPPSPHAGRRPVPPGPPTADAPRSSRQTSAATCAESEGSALPPRRSETLRDAAAAKPTASHHNAAKAPAPAPPPPLLPHAPAKPRQSFAPPQQPPPRAKKSVSEIDPDVQTIFRLWGQGRAGIDFAALRAAVQVYTMDDEQLRAVLTQYDEDRDGVLDLAEFASMMMVSAQGAAQRPHVSLYFQGDRVVTVEQLSQQNEALLLRGEREALQEEALPLRA